MIVFTKNNELYIIITWKGEMYKITDSADAMIPIQIVPERRGISRTDIDEIIDDADFIMVTK